ncbi:N-acetylglucosamine-specific PTS transporter subunit IIBC [Bacillus swezeyi]|uniref:N-acetylglucosamine-specific PTS transporter subunit IIBC n=1 Tax=Bacillus swezeyi TaxID=1925020 RepID=UPI002E1CAFB2|nr:N-acetylglucosamine-specific PTS transporter subunit IIBC [Bacillus swezeyi]MED2977958.1 N-acetylglucosamine-specific PTS transporter subunit IIBC [Bacillus swezeyi]
MLGFLQNIGRALMLPIAVLPAAGLLLALGREDLFNIPFIAASGQSILDQLPIIFAIGVAIGLSKDGHGAAALSGAIGYFVLTGGLAAINTDLNMGVLGGIISGVVAALMYNRFKDAKLPDWLGFFGGKRSVPIMTAFTSIILAGIFGFVWIYAQQAIDAVGSWIIQAGALGVGIFGLLNRLLLPLGLHHILNNMVWMVFGEFAGKTGDMNRFFAGDPSAGAFMTGFFPIMMFGLPAACFAIIAAAKKHRRKATAGLLIGLAFTSFLTGITEPIEFTFMFLSPLLFGIHALLTASAMTVTNMLGIHHGFTFSAGTIDYLLNFGIATKPLLLLPVGLVYGIIYFIIFYFLITKLNLKTPGREDEEEQENVPEPVSTAAGSSKYEALAVQYLDALGGTENIETLNNCVTRLRLKIYDAAKLDEKALKAMGAKGIVKLNQHEVQVIVGTDVEFLANEMRKHTE